MRIPRSYVEAYSSSLNTLCETARRELESRLAEVDWSLDVTEIREQVVAIMESCCGASSTMAARLAADFYDGLRAQFGIADEYKAVVSAQYDPKVTEGAVRAFAQDLVDGKPVETFVGRCVDRVDREARLAANRCVEHNARRDPRKPRWARVPTGPETCEFCIMLASRGFKYHGKEVASHAHANCDCRVIPSWDKARPEVEGYDPDYYLDCYKHREEHPEIREAINARRRELYAERKQEAAKSAMVPSAQKRKGAGFVDGAPSKKRQPFWQSEEHRHRKREIAIERASHIGIDSARLSNEQFFATHETQIGGVTIKKGQFGDKTRPHAREWGLDPYIEQDRLILRGLVLDMLENPDVVLDGKWRAVGYLPAHYFISGDDAAIVWANGLDYVTIVENGVNTNGLIRDAWLRYMQEQQ